MQDFARMKRSARLRVVPSYRKSFYISHLSLGTVPVITARAMEDFMRRNGFSMVEVLFVLILVGLIATIGFPRLQRGLEKQNVRSSKAMIATLAATARGTAIQRGCSATLNITGDSVWVTA